MGMGSDGLRAPRGWFAGRARDRTVEVHPPSRADEGGWVFIAAAFVVLVVIYTYGFEREASRTLSAATGASSGLLPYQVLFRDLPERRAAHLPRHAGRRRRGGARCAATTGNWPSVEALAADGHAAVRAATCSTRRGCAGARAATGCSPTTSASRRPARRARVSHLRPGARSGDRREAAAAVGRRRGAPAAPRRHAAARHVLEATGAPVCDPASSSIRPSRAGRRSASAARSRRWSSNENAQSRRQCSLARAAGAVPRRPRHAGG